jgi:hypothetical protein
MNTPKQNKQKKKKGKKKFKNEENTGLTKHQIINLIHP